MFVALQKDKTHTELFSMSKESLQDTAELILKETSIILTPFKVNSSYNFMKENHRSYRRNFCSCKKNA